MGRGTNPLGQQQMGDAINNWWGGVKQRFGLLVDDPVAFMSDAVDDVIPTAAEMQQWSAAGRPTSGAVWDKLNNLALAGVTGGGGLLGGKRMSAEEARRLGYWHDIGVGKKLSVPVAEMRATTADALEMAPKRAASPEDMLGSTLVPLLGDRTAAGKNLLGVKDVQFDAPVLLEGGPDFMRVNSKHGAAWAADKGAVTSLTNKIKGALDEGDVYMPYVAMGHMSSNFNTMMSDALLAQLRAGKYTKKAKKRFDQEVRGMRPEWLGIDHPGAMAQLENSGALRHAFNDRIALDEFVQAGFPDVAYTRFAITEPGLLDEPLHNAGYAIAKADPKQLIVEEPTLPHKTYNTQIGGNYFGSLEQSIPRDVMFPDFYKARRAIGAQPLNDTRSFQLSQPTQKANQEWLDGVMAYIQGKK